MDRPRGRGLPCHLARRSKDEKITDAVENAVKGLPGLIDGLWSEVSALAHEADHGLVPWEDVKESARRFTAMAQAAETFTEDWAKRTGWIGKITPISEGFESFMGYAGIVLDAATLYDPPDKGVLGNVDRGVAGVNAGLLIANLSMDEFPVVGEVVLIGTGVYLGGTYAYHHWRWFHNTCNAVGHFIATAATTVWHGAVKHMECKVENAVAVVEGVAVSTFTATAKANR